jgi:hypothetical protein
MEKGLEMVTIGTQRISKAFEFIRGQNSALKRQHDDERRGDFYSESIIANSSNSSAMTKSASNHNLLSNCFI